MFVYFLILLWVFICAILSLDLRISKLQQKRIILLLISIPLILLAGIRDGIELISTLTYNIMKKLLICFHLKEPSNLWKSAMSIW